MQTFDKIKEDVSERKNKHKCYVKDEKQKEIENQFFYKYYKCYTDIRMKHFGTSDLTDDQKYEIAQLAYNIYSRNIKKDFQKENKKFNASFATAAALTLGGAGALVYGALTNEPIVKLASVVACSSGVVVARWTSYHFFNSNRPSSVDYVDEICGVKFDKYKTDAENKFNKIKQEKNQFVK